MCSQLHFLCSLGRGRTFGCDDHNHDSLISVISCSSNNSGCSSKPHEHIGGVDIMSFALIHRGCLRTEYCLLCVHFACLQAWPAGALVGFVIAFNALPAGLELLTFLFVARVSFFAY